MLSLYFFIAWMHFVITGSIRYAFAFIVSLLILAMLKNYVHCNVNSPSSSLCGHKSIWDMTRILVRDQVDDAKAKKMRVDGGNNYSALDRVLLHIFGVQPPDDTDTRELWKYEDSAEFPFSSGLLYHKLIHGKKSLLIECIRLLLNLFLSN